MKEIEVMVGERGKQKRKGDTERDSGESERERERRVRDSLGCLHMHCFVYFMVFYLHIQPELNCICS